MKITQLYIDDSGLSTMDRDQLLNSGGVLRNLQDDSEVGIFHGVLSPTIVGAAVRNRVYNSFKNPRPKDDVAVVLIKNLQGTIVNVKGKTTWIAASQLQAAAEELAAGDGSLPNIQAAGLISGIFPNNKPGQESLVVTNNVISPKTKESYSAYLFKNKRLWVAALVIDVTDKASYAIPTPYAGVYYYKSKGGDASGNTGIARTWTFPDISDNNGVNTTAFSMDLPLGGQVITSEQASSGEIASNYVIESNQLRTTLKTSKNQQFVIYVPYEGLQTAATANVGPVRFVKDGDIYNALSSGKAGNGVTINQDNVLITASGDTITTTNQSDLGKVPLIKRKLFNANGTGTDNNGLLSIGLAAVAGIAGAKFLTSNTKTKPEEVTTTIAADEKVAGGENNDYLANALLGRD